MKVTIRQYANLLAKYLRPQWKRVALLGLLIALSLTLQLAKPQILRIFIDTATGTSRASLSLTAAIFMTVALLSSIVIAYSKYVSEDVGWGATNFLRSDITSHCLGLDMSFHKAHSSGEMIERIDGDINKLSNFFSQFIMGIAANVLLLVGVLALLFREDYRVGLALSIFALIAVTVLTLLRDLAVPHWTRYRQQTGQFFGFLTEHLAGTEDIRANGAASYVMNRFYSRLREWLPSSVKAYLGSTTMWSASIITFTIGNAIAFGFGAYLWRSQAITIGTVYLIVHYTELLRRPIDQIRTQMQELQRASASITRLNELLNTQSKLHDGPVTELGSGPLSIEFAGVGFNYEDDDIVLEDVSFTLKPGKVLGLLGRTGSGKTTLARLLLRLYDPVRGEIRLGNCPIRDTKLSHLRQKVTLVTQDVQLFQATVRENLTFFDSEIPEAKVLEILHDLGLDNWFKTLPQGLDTMLSSGGASLSAGEAQLLALARCFLAEPSIVVLDEASSRLDPATEHLIERAITKLLHNRTGVIIAHRLDTVERADDILILDKGKIVEHGARLELSADPTSRFSALLSTGLKEVLA